MYLYYINIVFVFVNYEIGMHSTLLPQRSSPKCKINHLIAVIIIRKTIAEKDQ